MASESVGDLLAGRPLLGVTGSSTVAAACHRLRQHGVGALAVLEGPKLVGILSERDISVRVIAGHRDPMLTLVREVMTPDPRTVPAQAPIPEALRVMRVGGFRHLPVTSGAAVIGMVSLRDIPHRYHSSEHPAREGLAVLPLG